MAKNTVTMTIRLEGLPETRQFVWELQMLLDDMRVGASPFSERLERALDRFTDRPDPGDFGPSDD